MNEQTNKNAETHREIFGQIEIEMLHHVTKHGSKLFIQREGNGVSLCFNFEPSRWD